MHHFVEHMNVQHFRNLDQHIWIHIRNEYQKFQNRLGLWYLELMHELMNLNLTQFEGVALEEKVGNSSDFPNIFDKIGIQNSLSVVDMTCPFVPSKRAASTL